MCRNLTNPLHTRIFHRYRWIKTLGHNMTNECRALLSEQLDQPFLFGDQGVNMGGFAVEERGDGVLFDRGGKRSPSFLIDRDLSGDE